MDTPLDEDGETSVGDLIEDGKVPGVDTSLLETEARDRIEQLVDRLDERSADIIRRRFGLLDGMQYKLADVGLVHGISAERVRQLERLAMIRLRKIADPDLDRA